MSANSIQIDGNHYKKREYQHWDFVIHTGISYLHACSTKYVCRWRDKNGLRDLKKTIHYIQKIKENRTTWKISWTSKQVESLDIFCAQLTKIEARIVRFICTNEYESALELIEDLTLEAECGASSNYVNQ